ncbi:MAG TPA: MerR family DNA-binding transcriptional regulator [Streptosporangiaceae bacterium]|nr:MerR family DNA-binding transcriptional regulator [Streptosporangiaceae bacterium]
MNQGRGEEFLSTGEFAHRTRLTIKALRVYDEAGLLRPAFVDPSTGHRRYAMGQVRVGLLIGMLRGADMSLAEIGLLVGEFDADREAAADRLERFVRELEIRHTGRRFLIRHIHAIL